MYSYEFYEIFRNGYLIEHLRTTHPEIFVWYWGWGWMSWDLNVTYHDAEISVIWLVKGGAIKLLILIRYLGKNIEVQRNVNANTALVALFAICFRCFFFNVKKDDNAVKLRQYLEIFL